MHKITAKGVCDEKKKNGRFSNFVLTFLCTSLGALINLWDSREIELISGLLNNLCHNGVFYKYSAWLQSVTLKVTDQSVQIWIKFCCMGKWNEGLILTYIMKGACRGNEKVLDL